MEPKKQGISYWRNKTRELEDKVLSLERINGHLIDENKLVNALRDELRRSNRVIDALTVKKEDI